MATFNLFSKRQRQRPTHLIYDEINATLRAQVVIIITDAYGNREDTYSGANEIMFREHPVVSFVQELGSRWVGAPHYVFQCIVKGDLDECLDGIETSLMIINLLLRDQPEHYARIYEIKLQPDDAIAELNARFLEHGVGYQFSVAENQLVRLDSQFLHEESVAPAIKLLTNPGFSGPAQEFAKAHQHHRAGEGKDAVMWAVKALESTARAICDSRGWPTPPNATIVPLLKLLFQNGLVPVSLQSHFDGLRTALESGLPTIGNSMARHGQGKDVKAIAPHIVAFAMHLCAAAIVFLVEAHLAPR